MPSTLADIRKALQSSQFSQALLLAQQLAAEAQLEQEEAVQLLYLKAVAQRYLNESEKALETLSDLIALDSENGRSYQEQGYCYLSLNQHSLALQALLKAVHFNPGLLSAWQQIKTLYQHSEHPDLSLVEHQINQLQKMPKPLLGAMDLMYEGKLHKAEQLCRQFLGQHKHHPDAMCLLAEVGARLKVFDDAEFLLESCVELYPDNITARASYIHLLNRLGKFEKCAQQASHYLQISKIEDEETTKVTAILANCRISLGALEEGKALYQLILDKHPDRAGIHLQLGHAYKVEGLLDKAVACYHKAQQLRPQYGDTYWSLANIKTYSFEVDELEQMKQQLKKAEATQEDKVHLNFALGKGYEDRKEFDASFSYYQAGNSLKKQTLSYDAQRTSELIEQQIKHCTKALFEERNGQGCAAEDPIFILGLPRSGSTLLEQILASHSQVDGTMELHNILGLVLKLRGRIADGEPLYPKNLWELSAKQLAQLGQNYIEETRSYRQGAPLFIDKMPNNFMHIGLIKLILPNAKIIDARRAPMACCFSGFKQLFGEGHEFSYDLSDIASYYSNYVRLMEHWQTVLPGQVLRVDHETLVSDFDNQVRRILEYCGLNFEQSCIEFYNSKRAIHTPSAQQVRQPISKAGIHQWTNYQQHLGVIAERLNNLDNFDG